MEMESHILITCPHSSGSKAETWVLQVGVAENTEGCEIFPFSGSAHWQEWVETDSVLRTGGENRLQLTYSLILKLSNEMILCGLINQCGFNRKIHGERQQTGYPITRRSSSLLYILWMMQKHSVFLQSFVIKFTLKKYLQDLSKRYRN